MARSDYDIINLSLEHELNEWLAEKGVVVKGQVLIKTGHFFLPA